MLSTSSTTPWIRATPLLSSDCRAPSSSTAATSSSSPKSFQPINQNQEKIAVLRHVNYSIFWKNLAPISKGAALQGSGWVWLAYYSELNKLRVETTVNQDPLVTKGQQLVPLEHAYYLQYKNVRPDYLKNIWKVINWEYASEVYEKAAP